MQIHSYQIHNVLNVYSKQLGQEKTPSKQKVPGSSGLGDRVSLTPEARRKAIVDKVASDIVSRITQFGPQSDVDHEIVSNLRDESGNKVDVQQHRASFKFDVIGEDNRKETKELSMEDSSFLMGQLENLAKKAVDDSLE